jgi:hypothetical protein
MGSPLGPPHLRDTSGRTFPVDRILKFSLHEDFIVFRARGATAGATLSPGGDAAVGARVYAVGNALGEGVVVRDGLLTSMTPEDQDGRWKWLRFSAAASPGNSGGPLLDDEGRVIGVVTARSPGENLNYALPIARVLEASERTGSIEVRSSFGLPILRQQMVAEFNASFALPASWEEFSRRLIDAGERQYEDSQRRLLQQHAADLPPTGRSSRLLAAMDRDVFLALISQQADDSWGLTEPSDTDDTGLDTGVLRVGSFTGAFSFMYWRNDEGTDPALYRDDKAFMDLLLKGIKLPRMIGTQAIRITSLGAPRQKAVHVDRFERIWQLRDWQLGYSDLRLVTLALPTPDGYVGLIRFTPAAAYSSTVANLRLMADYIHVAYDGNAAQWRTFQALEELCPPFLRELRFAPATGVAVSLPDLEVQVPATLLPLKAESTLTVFTGYSARNDRLIARPTGITLKTAPEDEESWIGIWAQPRPAADAGSELQKRWREMSAREDKFDGLPKYNPELTRFWTTSSLGDTDGNLLYEVTMSLKERSLLPRQISERRDALHAGLKLSNPGRE